MCTYAVISLKSYKTSYFNPPKGGFSSSRLGIVYKHPLLSLAASVEAARRWENRSIQGVCEDFHNKADAKRAVLDDFTQPSAHQSKP